MTPIICFIQMAHGSDAAYVVTGLLEHVTAATSWGAAGLDHLLFLAQGFEFVIIDFAAEAFFGATSDVGLEGVYGREHAAAGHTLVAILLLRLQLGSQDDVLECNAVLWSRPNFPSTVSGTCSRQSAHGRRDAGGSLFALAKGFWALPVAAAGGVWKTAGLLLTVFLHAHKVAVGGVPGPIDGAVMLQGLIVVQFIPDIVCQKKRWR